MRRTRLLLLVSLPVVMCATPSFAQDEPAEPAPTPTAPPDVVHTKSGGPIRGSLIDVTPGVQARIRLPSGEIVTIPWAEIVRIDARSRPVEPQPPQPAPPSSPPLQVEAPKPSAFHGPMVVVHIDSSKPVRLERLDTSRPNWDDMCTSPCDVPVPLDGEYRLVGTGLMASNRFRLEASAGERVVLDVSTASKGWFAAGGGMTGAAIFFGVYGIFWYGAGAQLKSLGDSASQGVGNAYTTLGIVLMAGGAILGAVGIPMLVSNFSTSVTQVTQPGAHPSTTGETSRIPLLGHTDEIARALPRPSMLAPLVTLSF